MPVANCWKQLSFSKGVPRTSLIRGAQFRKQLWAIEDISSSPGSNSTMSMLYPPSAFTVSSFHLGHPCYVRLFQKCSPPRRPRSRPVALAPRGSSRQHSPPSSSDSGQATSPLASDDSYLQCPQCLAVYQIDADELDESPRVIACSACLHEWHATENALLWGDEMALQVVVASKNPGLPSYVRQDSRSSKQTNNGNGVPTPGANNAREQQERNPNVRKPFSQNGESGYDSSEEEDDVTNNQWSEDTHSTTEQFDNVVLQSSAEEIKTKTDTIDKQVVSRNVTKKERISRQPMFTDSNATDEPQKTSESLEGASSNKGNRNFQNGRELEPITVFVGNLSFRATEEDLHRAFSGYGVVTRCQVPCHAGGGSKGYGFVVMRSRECGLKAIDELQGASILGRDISLTVALQQSQPTVRKGFRSRGEGYDTSGKTRGQESGFDKDNKRPGRRYGRGGRDRDRGFGDGRIASNRRSSPRR